MDEQLSEFGYWIERSLLNSDECSEIRNILGPMSTAGRRGLLDVPGIAKWAMSRKLVELVREHLGGEPFPVRAIYFNKSPEANWSVGWHQDRAIAISHTTEVPGFSGWSIKDGVTHVLPPPAVLERMLTLRIHLDDADASNGALRILAGTHRQGILSPDEICEIVRQGELICCEARTGDVLVMKPLVLHSSSRCLSERERRVLHIEYAVDSLPGGLKWLDQPQS